MIISSQKSNRIIFILSLVGLLVAAYLFYEYNITGPMLCPTGQGCDIVRASPYSSFLGISIPLLGIIFYLTMAILSVIHSHDLPRRVARKLQVFIGVSGVAFGIYLTYLEAFVIGAFCFWCVLSFIISVIILFMVVLPGRIMHDSGN